jgi:hypothetical protein
MQERHQQELSKWDTITCEPVESRLLSASLLLEEDTSGCATIATTPPSLEDDRLSKLEKARRKREARKDRERQRQSELEMEQEAAAGSSMREAELSALELQLKPQGLRVAEIPSDGNCLYRAIAAQCGLDYLQIRTLLQKQCCECIYVKVVVVIVVVV